MTPTEALKQIYTESQAWQANASLAKFARTAVSETLLAQWALQDAALAQPSAPHDFLAFMPGIAATERLPFAAMLALQLGATPNLQQTVLGYVKQQLDELTPAQAFRAITAMGQAPAVLPELAYVLSQHLYLIGPQLRSSERQEAGRLVTAYHKGAATRLH
jgi:hypothetical protein